jgi:excisionase family DNA binding protein
MSSKSINFAELMRDAPQMYWRNLRPEDFGGCEPEDFYRAHPRTQPLTGVDRGDRGGRGTVEQAAAILGIPRRTVQALAARGELPGAAKFGRRWTFELEKLRRYIRTKERQQCGNQKLQPAATGAAPPSGVASASTGANTGGRYTQVTRQLRARGAKPAKTE